MKRLPNKYYKRSNVCVCCMTSFLIVLKIMIHGRWDVLDVFLSGCYAEVFCDLSLGLFECYSNFKEKFIWPKYLTKYQSGLLSNTYNSLSLDPFCTSNSIYVIDNNLFCDVNNVDAYLWPCETSDEAYCKNRQRFLTAIFAKNSIIYAEAASGGVL